MTPHPQPTEVVLDEWIDRDLTAEARRGALPPAFAADELVAQAEEVLRAVGCRSPVMTGRSGVGKTAVVQELVRRAHAGEGIPLLRDARVVQVSLRAIRARFKEKSDAANFFGDLCTAIVTSPEPVVPFIRDVHLAYQLDWEPVVHRLVQQLGHPILAEATPRELDQLLEYWTDLTGFLVPIPVVEPPVQKVRALVAAWCTWQEGQLGRGFTADAQRIAVELTGRFMGDRPFPRKTLDLLRQTADFLGEDEDPTGEEPRPVAVRDVVRRFSRVTRVPPRLVDPDVQLDLTEVHDFVTERLLGQEEAVDAVVRMIALIKAGLADLRRPFGSFLFVGPTGVGKTHCAQLLADYLFGDPHRLIRVNMADYGSEHDVALLFGNPFANNARDQRGVLAQRLAGEPFGVLLLDEFEKAHRKVHDAFLQLFDEGRYINGRSEVVSVASLILVATSNAGAEVYREHGLGFTSPGGLRQLDRELDRRLHRTFRFELLNRFDRVVHFHPLDRSHIRAIARRELTELSKRDGLVGRGLTVEVDAEVLDWLVAHGYHPHFGARFLRREIERHVAGTLAEFIVRERPARGARLALGVRSDRIEARMVAVPDARAEVTVPTATGDKTRTLDPQRLVEEAHAWLERWEALEHESEGRRSQAQRLIDASAEPGFWDDVERAQDVLRRYKTLDARLQADRRLLRSAQRLRRALEADDAGSEELAAAVQRAAEDYRRWLDIGSEEGPRAAWLVLGPADVSSCTELLTDLVAMYRGWLRRRGLTYEVVAEEVVRGEPTRIVLEVEGPGVLTLLEMERGEHRRRAPGGDVERALVEVIPRRDGDPGSLPPGATVEDARRTRGVAVGRRAARLRLELPGRGLKLRLHGTSRDTLVLLGRDLAGAMAAAPDSPPEIARTYGLRGGTVYDPRTSASTPSLKDVLRGNLDTFLRAWEVR